ncbi:MAG: outer membrane protein transport protein [Verrucomicrobiota bacterium]
MNTNRPVLPARWTSYRQNVPLVLGLGLLLTYASVYGEGFRNPPPGTFSLGRSGGRIAHVDDSSAVHQNPANLIDLKESEVQFTPSIVYMGVDFDSSAAPGQSSKTEDPWKFLPNLFWATPLENTNITVGLGITAPFGLSVNWDNEGTSAFAPGGVLRYSAAHYNELMTMNFNPTVAFKLTENLSLGVGLDVMWSRLTLKQYYDWTPWGGAGDGTLKGQGEGFGYGGNLGLTWKITERQTLAVTYRSQMNVTYEGDTTIDNIAPFAAGAGVTARSDFSSGIDFPNMVALGYGIKITDTIRLETDVEWIQFSRFKSLVVDVHNNNLLFGGSPYVASQNWRDTITIGIGGDWQFAERWVLRAGYQYYQSPVPDSTYSPTIPDADQNVFTIGLGYRTGHHSFQVAYGLDFYDKRNVNTIQPLFNGTYDVTVHLFSLAYALSF